MRMVVHALAFLIYVLTYLIWSIMEAISPQSGNYYFGWAFETLCGAFAYVCLFFVIWHLGSKTKERVSSVSSARTISEDDIKDSEE